MVKERRKYRRKSAQNSILYNPVAFPDRKVPAKTFNISKSGAGIIIEQDVEPGTEVDFKIYNDRDNSYLEGVGRIVWKNTENNGGEIRAGLKYLYVKQGY